MVYIKENMMDKDAILYEEAWNYIVYKTSGYYGIQVMFCKSFIDYSVTYLLIEKDLLYLEDQSYFNELADNIRNEPDAFKNRISSNPNF